jgi:hypothetical protein
MVGVLMINSLRKLDNNKWTLITIDDPAFLPGKSIYDMIRLLLKIIDFKYIILYDIEGASEYGLIPELQKLENEVIQLREFLKTLCKIKQFDWGNFYLFKEYPKNWSSIKSLKYLYHIGHSDTTIRAVDDQYIYIYTPYEEIIKIIKENYTIESIKTDLLENLDYPA